MAHPLRLEFPLALYHVTSRGNFRQDILGDDRDRKVGLHRSIHEQVARFHSTAVALRPTRS
jgi:hypothetical protein